MDLTAPPIKITPCVLWAKASQRNYLWLVEHGQELGREYTRRYGKVHKSSRVIDQLSTPPKSITRVGLTPFVQCLPDLYRGLTPSKLIGITIMERNHTSPPGNPAAILVGMVNTADR